jgi:CBS domain-containing membrane protein
VGVVSSADVLKLDGAPTERRPGWTGIKVSEVMTRNIETIRPTVPLRHAAELFATGGFHSLLITANDGELVGIVTSSDIIRALIGHDAQGHDVPSGD